MPVKAISVSGTHYEMGRQHGLQVVHLRPLIVEAIEARFAQIESDSPNGTVAPLERFESLVREAAEMLREVDPPILEMIRGQAEALELDFDVLLRYDLGSYLRDDLTARRAMASDAPPGQPWGQPQPMVSPCWSRTETAPSSICHCRSLSQLAPQSAIAISTGPARAAPESLARG